MSETTLYSQCDLSHNNERQTAWIPARYAEVGRVLNLKTNGAWQTGWEVQQVYQTVPAYELPDAHVEVRQHRRNTGDSLPKKPHHR